MDRVPMLLQTLLYAGSIMKDEDCLQDYKVPAVSFHGFFGAPHPYPSHVALCRAALI